MRFFLLSVLVSYVFLLHADASVKKQILILHSYSQEYKWTKSQNESFVATLQQSLSTPFEFSVEYLDTKRLDFTDEYQSFFLRYLHEKYKGYHLDAIYVTDDNALKFFLNHEKLFTDTPIFFSGINDLSLANTLDQKRFMGVYETKDIVTNIELIRQFSPQTRDIWIVGDNSSTYKGIEADVKKKIRSYPKYTFHFIASDKIDNVRAQLPVSPKSFVVLTTIGSWHDHNGKNLLPNESIGYLKKNPHIILCSMEDSYVVGGVVGGYVTSGAKQGAEAATLLARYFKGESPAYIHSLLKSPNVYMFDHNELVKSRLILSAYTARNAIILHKDKSFIEKYQQMILNTAFILFILFPVFSIVVYFIFMQKNARVREMETALEESSSELVMVKNKLALIEESYE